MMSLKYCACEHIEELQQILALQQKNLPGEISEKEKSKEGFVTVSHDLELLEKMNTAYPHTIVKDSDKVVGYALSMHPDFGDKIAVLRPMFREINAILPAGKKYLVMGQVCIAKGFRGKGIFRKLYQTMWQTVKKDFDCIITEVDATNLRSLEAHYAIGFKHLKKYQSGGTLWHLIEMS